MHTQWCTLTCCIMLTHWHGGKSLIMRMPGHRERELLAKSLEFPILWMTKSRLEQLKTKFGCAFCFAYLHKTLTLWEPQHCRFWSQSLKMRLEGISMHQCIGRIWEDSSDVDWYGMTMLSLLCTGYVFGLKYDQRYECYVTNVGNTWWWSGSSEVRIDTAEAVLLPAASWWLPDRCCVSYPNLAHCSFLGILYCSLPSKQIHSMHINSLDPFTCLQMHLALIPQRLENQSQCRAFTAMAETAAASCGYGEGPAPLSLPIPSRKAPEAKMHPSNTIPVCNGI